MAEPIDDAPLTFEESRRHADACFLEALTYLRHWAVPDITRDQHRAIAIARVRAREARHALELAANHNPTPKETT
jgi:hypothetical protein